MATVKESRIFSSYRKGRELRIKAFFAGVTALLMLGIYIAPAAAAGNQTFVCKKTGTSSMSGAWNFPQDCDSPVPPALIPAGYETLVINARMKCNSSTLDVLPLKMNFNGDFAANYDSFYQEEDFAGNNVIRTNITYYEVGEIVCNNHFTVPDDADTGIEIIIPNAISTAYHKPVITHLAGTDYDDPNQTLVSMDTISGGIWHRPAKGAITQFRLWISGFEFSEGSTVEVYAR